MATLFNENSETVTDKKDENKKSNLEKNKDTSEAKRLTPKANIKATDKSKSVNNGYVVLARKYRPNTFNDLIGQDVLVRTLANSIDNNRIAHAFIFTGIRGVGKTSTARILAKSLNCTGVDGQGQETIYPCQQCENCLQISQSQSIDVTEIDAASHTGVSEIRQILDNVQYSPISSRYRIYIIDEVHMLSNHAFNALLKTLEEPPKHVKFILATTDIHKVPVTILSRCQRFDLPRVDIKTLEGHFRYVLDQEKIPFDEESINLISQVSEGSVRDGLSLLDQAIASGNGVIKNETIYAMLGILNNKNLLDIFTCILEGDMAKALTIVEDVYQSGINPTSIITRLMMIVHMLTVKKISPDDNYKSDTSMFISTEWSEKYMHRITIPELYRLWQMLLTGLKEMQVTGTSKQALEMVLIKIAYSQNFPLPKDIIEAYANKNSQA